MMRADLHFAHDPMRPTARHISSGSPPHLPENDCSVCPSKAHRGSLRDDFLHPGRLTRKLSNSKYSRPSLDTTTSEAKPLESIKRIPLHSRRANTDPTSYEQPSWNSPGFHRSLDIGPIFDDHDSLPRKVKVKTRVNIKPLLRKISRDGGRPTSLDLSRSSLEYEGLGIYTNLEHERHPGDYFGSITPRRAASGIHNRSISDNCQFSAARSPSVSKRSSYNFHPMRQAPSAYTPPLSQSYQTSSGESDGSEENATPCLPEGESSAPSRSDSFHPIKPPRLSLQTHNDASFPKSPAGTPSSVTGRHSFGYSRDHDGSTLDSPSPISRSSLDFVFRPKQRASTDPIARAATVQAARKAFEEREAAKAQKFERHQMKAEERQIRRKEKQQQQQWWGNSMEDQIERTDMDVVNADLGSSISEKSSSFNVAPGHDSPPLPPQTRTASWKSQSKDTWMLFLTWLRTRLFKLRRRLRKLQ